MSNYYLYYPISVPMRPDISLVGYRSETENSDRPVRLGGSFGIRGGVLIPYVSRDLSWLPVSRYGRARCSMEKLTHRKNTQAPRRSALELATAMSDQINMIIPGFKLMLARFDPR